MFLNRRKSPETAGEDTPMPDAVKKKKGKKETTAEHEDALVAEIAGLEEMVNKRTRDLEAAKTQLNQLQRFPDPPGDLKKAVTAEDLLTRPNKDKARKEPVALAEEVKDELEESQERTDKTLEKADASKAETGTAVAEPEQAAEPAGGDESDDFFSADEEEENRLAGLIASLPEVTLADIMREAEEVKALAQEWFPNKEG